MCDIQIYILSYVVEFFECSSILLYLIYFEFHVAIVSGRKAKTESQLTPAVCRQAAHCRLASWTVRKARPPCSLVLDGSIWRVSGPVRYWRREGGRGGPGRHFADWCGQFRPISSSPLLLRERARERPFLCRSLYRLLRKHPRTVFICTRPGAKATWTFRIIASWAYIPGLTIIVMGGGEKERRNELVGSRSTVGGN